MLKTNMDKILITGYNGGIGKEIAKSLFVNFNVITTSRKNADYCGDLSDFNFAKYLAEKTGFVDTIICCAGGIMENDTINNSDGVHIDVINNNLVTAINITKAYMPFMKLKRKGSFIYFSSNLTSSIQSSFENLSYTISKTAIEKMTEILSNTESKNGLRFYCLTPGFVRTKKNENKMKNQLLLSKIGKIGGYCTSEQIVEVINFIIKNESITGTKIKIDGGNQHP
jgi:3-oxoacyl-[acyl-carrier protein] reductase